MAQVPISALPAGAPINGTEEVPMVQGGVTVRVPSAALVGPAGPRGPAGPPGPGSFATVTPVTANYAVSTGDDVVLADSSGGPITLTLPGLGTTTQKCVAIMRTDAFGGGGVSIVPAGGDGMGLDPNPFPLSPAPTSPSSVLLVPDRSSGNWRIIAER